MSRRLSSTSALSLTTLRWLGWQDVAVRSTNCFPADVWREEGGELKFVKLPGLRDWSRVFHYSPYVRRLGLWHLPGATLPRINPQALWTVAALKPTLAIFPNLRTLSCVYGSQVPDECTPALLSLIGAHVRDIYLRLRYLPDILPSTLSYISEKFSHLNFLTIKFTSGSVTSPLPELSLPLTTHSLTRFECHDRVVLDKESFNLLSHLPRLESLVCTLHDLLEGLLLVSGAAREAPPFQALRELYIDTVLPLGVVPSSVVALNAVQIVRLTLWEPPEARHIPFLFHGIRRLFSPSALTYLNVELKGGSQPIKLPACLRPLLDFRALESLVVCTHCGLCLDNRLCAEMAQAWPRIQYISLCSRNPSEDVLDLPTLEGLVPFAIHCPDLNSLGLQLNAQDTQYMQMSLPRRSKRPSLTSLGAVCCPISRPDQVATFLARTFPRLTNAFPTSYGSTGSGPAWKKDWQEVNRYLELFASIRADEREWVEVEREGENQCGQIPPI
ncbi:hypothetical protein L226DRAFT_328618 [Lentinus tigrinus ALCF2SS1-7]|uniref:uncharacterized protein n=1 Tax=Lentinus tigrinus ALCF2SS1-7 TaxID=1328758 RepID=UPI001166080A|nr:hypothetical protein L226DRAFT_328618 [Lentinus tigrinus ALCF2SS1-7]